MQGRHGDGVVRGLERVRELLHDAHSDAVGGAHRVVVSVGGLLRVPIASVYRLEALLVEDEQVRGHLRVQHHSQPAVVPVRGCVYLRKHLDVVVAEPRHLHGRLLVPLQHNTARFSVRFREV